MILNKVVPANYYKTSKLGKNLNENWALNGEVIINLIMIF